MNTECLNNLISLQNQCENATSTPLFYLDDIEGINQFTLSQLASEKTESGANLATSLIQSSIRLLLADIDSVMSPNYRISSSIVELCSSCNFSGFYSNASTLGTGIIVKNMSNSKFSSLLLDNLKVKVATSGEFVIKIDDHQGNVKEITQSFIANEEFSFININYETNSKFFTVTFNDNLVQLYSISCPVQSGCGCGSSNTVPTSILINGYANGVENSTQYSILPCVKIKCSYDNIICSLVQSSPKLFALALLYLTASKIFNENLVSQRVNRTASFDKEEKKDKSEYYYELYRERLMGNPNKGVLGIAQAINNNLKTIKDKCINCDSIINVAWAIG